MNEKKRYACPCCEFLTYDEVPSGTYGICPVCFWEDDPVQLKDENYAGGANHVSLVEARENFRRFSAKDQRVIPFVRPPRIDEYFESKKHH